MPVPLIRCLDSLIQNNISVPHCSSTTPTCLVSEYDSFSFQSSLAGRLVLAACSLVWSWSYRHIIISSSLTKDYLLTLFLIEHEMLHVYISWTKRVGSASYTKTPPGRGTKRGEVSNDATDSESSTQEGNSRLTLWFSFFPSVEVGQERGPVYMKVHVRTKRWGLGLEEWEGVGEEGTLER